MNFCKISLSFLGLLAVIASAFAFPCPECSKEADTATNAYRRQMGLPPLTFSRAMYLRCLAHSREMAARGSLFHTDLGGGVHAENVAMRTAGSSSGTAMTRQWIDSPPHRGNMLGNYECGATALYEEGGNVWGTQMFGDC